MKSEALSESLERALRESLERAIAYVSEVAADPELEVRRSAPPELSTTRPAR